MPPVIARLLTDRFARMLVVSTLLGAALAFVGLFVSYFLDIASGASIVLLSAAMFAVTITFVSIRNWFRFGKLALTENDLGKAEAQAVFD